jgi:hypothetical protein
MLDTMQTALKQTGPLPLKVDGRGTRPLSQPLPSARQEAVGTKPLALPAEAPGGASWDALNALMTEYNGALVAETAPRQRQRKPRLSTDEIIKLKRKIATKRKAIKLLEVESWRKNIQVKQLRVLLNRLKAMLGSATELQRPGLLQRISHMEQAIRRIEVDLGAIHTELGAQNLLLADLTEALNQGMLLE